MDNNNEEDFDEEAHNIEYEQLKTMFPNANFSICMSISELDDIVSTDKKIIIKCEHNCFCYSVYKRRAAYFTVHNLNNAGISNKMIIQVLINAEYETGCDHIYLEKIERNMKISPNSVKQFVPFFGS